MPRTGQAYRPSIPREISNLLWIFVAIRRANGNLPLSFVPNLAFDLLDQLWRGFDAVCFSRVLCRLLQQFALTFSAGLVVAARHEVTAAKYFCHDDSSSGLFRIFTSPARMAASRRSTRAPTIKIALI